MYSAIRQDTLGDYIGRSLSILFISVPAFWLGTMIVVYPAIWWGWSPTLEYIPFSSDPEGNLLQFLLPGFIMGMVLGGTLMRVTRTMMLEVLRQDYVRTAWAKGLGEEGVIWRHVLKNALIPVVTVIGVVVPDRHRRHGGDRANLRPSWSGSADLRSPHVQGLPGDLGRESVSRDDCDPVQSRG